MSDANSHAPVTAMSESTNGVEASQAGDEAVVIDCVCGSAHRRLVATGAISCAG